MSKFAKWITDDRAIATDHLDFDDWPHIQLMDDDTGDAVWLSATDIKRLMQCVEHWESDERSESI